MDISQFNDPDKVDQTFDQVMSRFNKTAYTPYQYKGKTYGVPETFSFGMLFYRKDVLSELEMEMCIRDSYYPHFGAKRFVGKKNAHRQGKSAVHPAGLTSLLTQYAGIFLRQNPVSMCALWLYLKNEGPKAKFFFIFDERCCII